MYFFLMKGERLMLFISPLLTNMAKGKRDDLLEGSKKNNVAAPVDPAKQKDMLRKLSETKIKLNK